VTIGKQGNKFTSQFQSEKLNQATAKAKKITSEELSASFKITKDGKPITPEKQKTVSKILGKDYRRSKVNPNRFVERKNKRLDSKTESKIIQNLRGKTLYGNKVRKAVDKGVSLRKIRMGIKKL